MVIYEEKELTIPYCDVFWVLENIIGFMRFVTVPETGSKTSIKFSKSKDHL